MIRTLTQKARNERYDRNHAAAMRVYARGADLFPADYLICHQESEPARVAKIKAEADKRRQRRNTKRLKEERS